jgi:hypothetical protein
MHVHHTPAVSDDAHVGILWRAEWDPVQDGVRVADSCRLRAMFAAFHELGVDAEPVVYSDDRAEAVHEQLLALDGVLVWVNPIEQGRDRSRLDALLLGASEAGTWVSAHPDVILRMATKQVLVDTASMSWSAETHLYATHEQLRDELPGRLAVRGPLVLKQRRGMGGDGVWKVEVAGGDSVRAQHASGDGVPETLPFHAFLERCTGYFAACGLMVEQPFLPRLDEGMIRVYLCHDRVVGFAHQFPRGLLPPGSTPPPGKVFELPTAPQYEMLRTRMETEWVPELQRLQQLERHDLPVIWDADFLYGPKTPSGEDTYELCEINASSTFAFPEHAMPMVARAALERISRARAPRGRGDGDGGGPSARSSSSASSSRRPA